MTEPTEPRSNNEDCIDAAELIGADLQNLQRHRRRHFIPAWGVALGMLGLATVIAGLRSDLLQQPWWQLGLQIAAWILCLLVFPAVGVGLWFPSRGTRLALVAAGVVTSVLAALGVPTSLGGGASASPCVVILVAVGLAVLGVGAISGAFAQRRCPTSVYWVASGIGLSGLGLVTWVCPTTLAGHVLWLHLVPALAIALVAGIVGRWLHRRSRTRA